MYETRRLPWDDDTWAEIQAAVHAETRRVAVAQKFLPLCGPLPDALTVPSDSILRDDAGRLTVREATVAPLVEIWSEFALTPQQVAEESHLHTARTLAIRGANNVARAQDALIVQGDAAVDAEPLLAGGVVRLRSGPAGRGLLGNSGTDAPPSIPVEPGSGVAGGGASSGTGERIPVAVAEAYDRLQDQGHDGPYALVLPPGAYGDAFTPGAGTLVLPADRIQTLVTAGFYGSSSVPPSSGLFVSLGGDSMDLVIGRPAAAEFLFEDEDGKSRFRVRSRFTLRLKDPTAVIRLDFQSSVDAEKPTTNRRRRAA